MCPWLASALLLASAPASADPFFVWGERTAPGQVGLNPYVLMEGEGRWGATLYGLVGVSPHVDVILGAGGAWDSGVEPAPVELMPRWFPAAEHELAIAAHLVWVPDEALIVGPELHFTAWPTEVFGVWVNAGARVDLAEPSVPSPFAWFGFELGADVPFVALEVDVEPEPGGVPGVTLIPSIGAWLGPRRETGLSTGLLVSPGPEPLGVGVWAWRTFGAVRSRDDRGQSRS